MIESEQAAVDVPRPTKQGTPAPPEVRGLLLDELSGVLAELGERPFRARQIMNWLWRKGATSFEAMTDLPAALRGRLAQALRLSPTTVRRKRRAADGTLKLLVGFPDGAAVESVVIPTGERVTLCLSSQVGCALGCVFCATGRMGLYRNLSAGEILGQLIEARAATAPAELTNYVFMGMGEPLANYAALSRSLAIMTAPWGLGISPRRITVSTVGLVPLMGRLLSEFAVNLAVSLHATTDELRGRLIPVNRRYPLAELLAACRDLPLERRRRITFEYVMLCGVNDGRAEAQRLAALLRPLRAKVNLIVFNSFPGAPFGASDAETTAVFQEILRQAKLTATVRQSRGADIAAACGQLWRPELTGGRPRREGAELRRPGGSASA